MCEIAFAREAAHLDAIEAGRIGATDPVASGYARVFGAIADLGGALDRERRERAGRCHE